MGSPNCGMSSAATSGRDSEMIARVADLRDRERGRVGLGLRGARRDDRDRERAGAGGRARHRVDEMMEPPAGSEAPPVASGRGDPSARELERSGHAVGHSRVRDVHAPRPSLGWVAPDGDVAAQIDQRSRQRGPCRAHRVKRARRGEALADAAEVDGRPPLDARPTRALGRCRCARRPASHASGIGRSLREQLEGAVVASGGERREDRRVEPPAGFRCAREARLQARRRAACRRRPTSRRRGSAATGRCSRRSATRRARRPRPRVVRRRAPTRVRNASRELRRRGDRAARAHRTKRLALAAPRVMPAPRRGGPRAGALRPRECRRCRPSGRRPRSGARHQDAREDEPDDGSRDDPGEDQAARPGEVGADVEGVVEADREGREAGVVHAGASGAGRCGGGRGKRPRGRA